MNKEIQEIAKIVVKELDKSTDGAFYTEEIATALHKAGYRKQSETTTFYKDPNIKDWAESEYAWCERPCDSTRSMRAVDKKGSIVGYASEHYWTWCGVKEVKKVSAIEFMRHFANKQSDTVEEFAEKLKEECHKAITHNYTAMDNRKKADEMWYICCGQNDGLNFVIKTINELAEQFGKEV